ncbi:hypothetical protein E2C01_089735 [Portunus trituberculatus]|uniref:Uncharacterized protein n=1 Tax=Portunus trituberculatus TaxID=210409 RepID=A0A5B7J9M0_PORTR|nr:hypothetical protein [Portunus trituberculatus]
MPCGVVARRLDAPSSTQTSHSPRPAACVLSDGLVSNLNPPRPRPRPRLLQTLRRQQAILLYLYHTLLGNYS